MLLSFWMAGEGVIFGVIHGQYSTPKQEQDERTTAFTRQTRMQKRDHHITLGFTLN